MDCPDCAKLRVEIAELSRALDGALWVDNPRAEKLARVRGVSPQQGSLLLALFNAYPERLTSLQLTELITLDHSKDYDQAQRKYGSVVVCHIRKKLGEGVIESAHGRAGYSLYPAEHERLTRLLGNV